VAEGAYHTQADRRLDDLVVDRATARSAILLSNILPAALISLIALSYLEEDGLTLALAVAIALAVLAVDAKILYDLMQPVIKISIGASSPS
jgi:hypothetical protein